MPCFICTFRCFVGRCKQSLILYYLDQILLTSPDFGGITTRRLGRPLPPAICSNNSLACAGLTVCVGLVRVAEAACEGLTSVFWAGAEICSMFTDVSNSICINDET